METSAAHGLLRPLLGEVAESKHEGGCVKYRCV